MIPTETRFKLPRHLSYPVGAQVVSEALADASHFGSLVIKFWDQAVEPASEFNRLLRERAPYRILEASYRPACKPGISASNSMIEKGWYAEKWELHVYPVLLEFRHTANRLLRERGLPEVASWLKSSARPGWRERPQQLTLTFGPTDESLSVQVSSGV